MLKNAAERRDGGSNGQVPTEEKLRETGVSDLNILLKISNALYRMLIFKSQVYYRLIIEVPGMPS
jgi:hypothetical protein